MNWTSREPIEGMRCIVRTIDEKLFPAIWKEGAWWHSKFNFEIADVCRWIVYPGTENENLASCIPDEVLLRYAIRDYRAEAAKVDGLRKLNKDLYSECVRLKKICCENDIAQLKERKDYYKTLSEKYKRTLVRIRGILNGKKLLIALGELAEPETNSEQNEDNIVNMEEGTL